MPQRRELALIWAAMLSGGLPNATILLDRPVKTCEYSRLRVPAPMGADPRFPSRMSAA